MPAQVTSTTQVPNGFTPKMLAQLSKTARKGPFAATGQVTVGPWTGVAEPTVRKRKAPKPGLPALIAPGARERRQFFSKALQTALESIDILVENSREVADAYRWEQVGDANRQLAKLIGGVRGLLRLASVAAQSANLDLAQVCRRDGAAVDTIEETRNALDQLMEAQMARDWTAVADTLDHDLASALGGWREVLDIVTDAASRVEVVGLAS